MKIHIYDTETELIKGLADYFVATVNAAIRKKDECTGVGRI